MTVVIPFTLPGLNEYIDAERKNKYKGADMKRKWQHLVAMALKKQLRKQLREPVTMIYTWTKKTGGAIRTI